MSTSRQPQFWASVKMSKGRVGMQMEIQPRTVDEQRLLIPGDFWEAKGGEVGQRATLFWAYDDPASSSKVDIVVAGGKAFFGRGWLRFSSNRGVGCWDIVRMIWLRDSIFHVRKMSEEDLASTPAHLLPSEIVNLESEAEEEEEEEEEEAPVGKKLKTGKVKLKPGSDFGRVYPKYTYGERELCFPLKDAVALNGEPGRKDWVVIHSQSNNRWGVTMFVYHNPHYPRAVLANGWPAIRNHFKFKKGDIMLMLRMQMEIQPRTVDEQRLLIPGDFWEAKGGEVGQRATLFWAYDDPASSSKVDIVVAGGKAFFGRGWLRFSSNRGVGCWDIVRMIWLRDSIFHVRKMSEEDLASTPAHLLPSEIVNLESEAEEEEEEEEEEAPVGKKLKTGKVKLKPGSDFGRVYPKYTYGERELCFPLKDAVALNGEPGRKDWVVIHSQSNNRWGVTMFVYHNPHYPRAVLANGWPAIRNHFKFKKGDIISFKILDRGGDPPTMQIDVQKHAPRSTN